MSIKTISRSDQEKKNSIMQQGKRAKVSFFTINTKAANGFVTGKGHPRRGA